MSDVRLLHPVLTADILKCVEAERGRQDEKWDEQSYDFHLWLTILMEEVGEVARAVWDEHEEHAAAELIEVAAVAVAAVEDFYRRTK